MFDGIFQVVQPVFDWTPIIQNILLSVVTAAIGFVSVAVRSWVNANKDDKNFQLLNDIVEVAVQAAEQLYGKQDGETKKTAALVYAENELAKRGIKIDLESVENAIEAAVLREFNYPATVTPAAPPTETIVTSEASSPSDGS